MRIVKQVYGSMRLGEVLKTASSLENVETNVEIFAIYILRLKWTPSKNIITTRTNSKTAINKLQIRQ